MISDNNHRYGEVLSRLTLPQKELLYAVASEGRSRQITSGAFIRRHHLQSASSVQAAVKKLLSYGLLSSENSEYYIDDLEGFRVHTEDGRDIGEVLSVEELPTVNAFNIKFNEAFQSEFSKKPVFAPWIDDCVLDIDDEGEFIVCDAAYLKALCPEDHSSEARPESDGEA